MVKNNWVYSLKIFVKLLISLLLLITFNTGAQEVNVGLEPFPPFINEDGTALQ
jgi:hypothetical protein